LTSAKPVGEGVYRLGTDWVGWYLVVAGDAVTVVDCGFPGYHGQLAAALAELRLSSASIRAVVLTHYHPDHVGSAERIQAETGATVYVPTGDAEGVRRGKVPLPPGMLKSLWRPRMMRYMAHAGRNGAGAGHGVSEFRTYADDEILEDAAGLRAIHTPGHTGGHCSLLAERVGVLFAGDALATVSLLDGAEGPRLIPFNEDTGRARESLSRLEGLAAETVVPGHGRPFTGTPAAAVAAAQEPAT
jgi:glyoxylase-like metal-dependent hydrolase (beta-lactamase superfamily II)